MNASDLIKRCHCGIAPSSTTQATWQTSARPSQGAASTFERPLRFCGLFHLKARDRLVASRFNLSGLSDGQLHSGETQLVELVLEARVTRRSFFAAVVCVAGHVAALGRGGELFQECRLLLGTCAQSGRAWWSNGINWNKGQNKFMVRAIISEKAELCSRRFWNISKVPEGFRIFQKITKWSKIKMDIPKCTKRFRNILKCSRKFQIVMIGSKRFQKISKWFKMIKNVTKYFKMFFKIPKSYKRYQNDSDFSKRFRNGEK